MKKKIKLAGIIISTAAVCMVQACGIYSFSGASISPDIKTVAVGFFENNAPLVVPTLSQSFGEMLKDRIVTQTGLSLIRTSDADIEFEGQITDYNTRPIAIQGNEIAGQNRLTISVKVKFINNKEIEKSFESTFIRYADYPGDRNLTDVENDLIRQISTQLVDDIYNKAFVNW